VTLKPHEERQIEKACLMFPAESLGHAVNEILRS
jgi:hypothetical protein